MRQLSALTKALVSGSREETTLTEMGLQQQLMAQAGPKLILKIGQQAGQTRNQSALRPLSDSSLRNLDSKSSDHQSFSLQLAAVKSVWVTKVKMLLKQSSKTSTLRGKDV